MGHSGAVVSMFRLVIGGCLLGVRLNSIKGPRCFHKQETLPLLLSTGWFQE